MSEPEVVYCDDYEAISGNTIASTVQAKVLTAPETPEAETSNVDVETKAAE